jgi:hypothetical protein
LVYLLEILAMFALTMILAFHFAIYLREMGLSLDAAGHDFKTWGDVSRIWMIF